MGLGGGTHELHRDGVLARITSFDLDGVRGAVRLGVMQVRGRGVHMGGEAVIMVVVAVVAVRVRMHVLQHSRRGGRQHGHGNERSDGAEHGSSVRAGAHGVKANRAGPSAPVRQLGKPSPGAQTTATFTL